MGQHNEKVHQFLASLDHPSKAEVERVRAIILGANNQITEHIKWNAPSFCVQGEDRITFNLHAKSGIQLVFHRGAKVKDSSAFKLDDPTELLDWITNDRAKVEFKTMDDVEAKAARLVQLVNLWIEGGEAE